MFTDDRRAAVEPDRSGSRFTSANVRCAIPVDALTDVLDRPVSFTVPGNRDRRSGSHNRMTCRTGSETRDPCCPVAAGEVRSVHEPAGDRIPVCFGDGERVGNPPAHKTDSRSFRVTASPADNTRRSFDRNLCCDPQITVSVGGPDCLTGEPDNRPVALGTQPASTPTASPTCTRTSSRADDDRTRRHPRTERTANHRGEPHQTLLPHRHLGPEPGTPPQTVASIQTASIQTASVHRRTTTEDRTIFHGHGNRTASPPQQAPPNPAPDREAPARIRALTPGSSTSTPGRTRRTAVGPRTALKRPTSGSRTPQNTLKWVPRPTIRV